MCRSRRATWAASEARSDTGTLGTSAKNLERGVLDLRRPFALEPRPLLVRPLEGPERQAQEITTLHDADAHDGKQNLHGRRHPRTQRKAGMMPGRPRQITGCSGTPRGRGGRRLTAWQSRLTIRQALTGGPLLCHDAAVPPHDAIPSRVSPAPRSASPRPCRSCVRRGGLLLLRAPLRGPARGGTGQRARGGRADPDGARAPDDGERPDADRPNGRGIRPAAAHRAGGDRGPAGSCGTWAARWAPAAASRCRRRRARRATSTRPGSERRAASWRASGGTLLRTVVPIRNRRLSPLPRPRPRHQRRAHPRPRRRPAARLHEPGPRRCGRGHRGADAPARRRRRRHRPRRDPAAPPAVRDRRAPHRGRRPGAPGPREGADTISWLAPEFNAMADSVTGLAKEVRDQREQLETIINSIDDGIAVLDSRRRVIAANDAFLRRVGRRRETWWAAAAARRAPGCAGSRAAPRRRAWRPASARCGSANGAFPEGAVRWEEVHTSPLRDAAGGVHLRGRGLARHLRAARGGGAPGRVSPPRLARAAGVGLLPRDEHAARHRPDVRGGNPPRVAGPRRRPAARCAAPSPRAPPSPASRCCAAAASRSTSCGSRAASPRPGEIVDLGGGGSRRPPGRADRARCRRLTDVRGDRRPACACARTRRSSSTR